MIQVTPQMRLLVAIEPADFCRGIDGLARVCRKVLRQDPFSGYVFVFGNRCRKAIKVLVYDGQGFWLCQKRLSKGRFPWWPQKASAATEALEAHQLTAQLAAGVGQEKYDAESASMIALLKYGSGLPFNRLERLEGRLGIPLPAATQWEIVAHSAGRIEPVLAEMIRHAAQGRLFHNDDSAMKIPALCGLDAKSLSPDGSSAPARKGVFTSAIVAIVDDLRIALFFTGHRHAGENLAAVLKQRASGWDEHRRSGFPPEDSTCLRKAHTITPAN